MGRALPQAGAVGCKCPFRAASRHLRPTNTNRHNKIIDAFKICISSDTADATQEEPEPEERISISLRHIAHTPRGHGQGQGPRDLKTAASSWAFDLIVGIQRLPRTHLMNVAEKLNF